jgi:hypothetical protein
VFDTMRHIRPDLSTVCVGLAASMGAFLLASGHQGKRYSLPNSRIMIHQPLGGAQGQAADIEIQVRRKGFSITRYPGWRTRLNGSRAASSLGSAGTRAGCWVCWQALGLRQPALIGLWAEHRRAGLQCGSVDAFRRFRLPCSQAALCCAS